MTHRALYQGKEPSEWNLCLNTHLPETIGGRWGRHKGPRTVSNESVVHIIHGEAPLRILERLMLYGRDMRNHCMSKVYHSRGGGGGCRSRDDRGCRRGM